MYNKINFHLNKKIQKHIETCTKKKYTRYENEKLT